MSAAINFSQFAYRSTKPRLTFYERSDKENVPVSPVSPRRSPTPNNATSNPGPRSARDTPRGENERLTVVPETPNEERSSASGRRRRRMRPAAERESRRKRQRLSSSSSSETETESRDAEKVGGARGRTRGGGLFGSTLVSKRQKRSVELSLFKYRRNPSKKSSPNAPRRDDHRKEAADEGSSEVTDSPSPVSKPQCQKQPTVESDSESGLEESFICQRDSPTASRLSLSTSPPPQQDGWLTCRRRQGKPQQKLHALTSGGDVRKKARVGECRELESLSQLFPQYSERFLRERLRSSAGVDEAVASILASDADPLDSPKRPTAQPKSRRIRLLSDSQSTSSDDDLPVVHFTTSTEKKRRGARRGRPRLDDSLDDDKHVVSSSARPAAHCISSDSSESEREEEEEKEQEGAKRERKDGEEKEGLMERDGREDEASKEDQLSSVTESGKGAGFSKSCKTGSFRYLNKNKGGTPDLDELEGELSDFSDDEEDFSDVRKAAILSLLDGISSEEAQAVPGLGGSRAGLLLAQRPFHNWEQLVEAVTSVKGLSQKCLEGCVRLLKEREMLARLLSECQAISSSIQSLVDLKKKEEMEQSQEDAASEAVDFSLPSMISPGLVLKPYQKVGVSWLSLLHSQNLNAILADEMGLGKTIQAIVFLSHLYEQGWKRPHLIVVPSSTIDNWARELHHWSPSFNVLTYWGSMEERADMRREMLFGEYQDYYDVILTTYTICIGRSEDRSFMRKLRLKTLVLDEGHMLKNMATLKYNHLMKIQAERRLLLTGTPLQNNLLELMSLLSFVMPSVFRPYLQPLQSAFRHSRHTAEVGDYYMEQVSRAKEIMRPFILRRLKKEVLNQLPEKVEKVEYCSLTPEQLQLYQREVELGRKEMKNGGGKELVKSMSVLTQLRKAANHPLLLRHHYSDDIIASMSTEILKEAEYRDADCRLVAEDMAVMTDFELHNLCLRHQSLETYSLSPELIKESGKLKYLEKKLRDCKEQGRRVLIFSQFTMILDILETWLQLIGHAYLRLDGSTHMNDRQMLIDQYNSSDNILVFLLSTKAGGLGINLTSASVVILHDIDFNPYNDKQAEDRCHRVGQTREVEVVRLVGRDTVEEEILRCAEQKLKLEQDMTAGSQLSKTDMASLLSQGLKL